MFDIQPGAEMISVDDIIARIGELREYAALEVDEAEEFISLNNLMSDIVDLGADVRWEGEWYPVSLIHESYFTEYAQQLAEDIGAVDHNAAWPARHIDWDAAADELRNDYSEFTYGGQMYLTR